MALSVEFDHLNPEWWEQQERIHRGRAAALKAHAEMYANTAASEEIAANTCKQNAERARNMKKLHAVDCEPYEPCDDCKAKLRKS